MKLYKVLGPNGKCCNGGKGTWHLPTRGRPGKWMPAIKGNLKPCRNGYHLCRREDLIHWLDAEIYEAEYRGEIVKDDDKVVVREARLVRKLPSWDERIARFFAADCAEHSLHLYTSRYPNDDRPAKAILAARDFANEKITRAELSAAESAARSAAWSAWSAWSAAWSAAESAAESAAWSAAESAAESAARSAAWSAAESAECKWQTKRLFKYLNAPPRAGSRRVS